MTLPAPARLLAAHRARETDRADAVFRDPYARALLGPLDDRLARVVAGGDPAEWFYTARTYVIDRLITREVAAGADAVVNLAAGLDARPYRLALPPELLWVDVDQPEVLAHKAEVLAAARPTCRVQSHHLDLSNPDARRGAFRELARSGNRVLVVSEGLLIHLMGSDVRELAADLAAPASFHRWITDLVSPPLLETLDQGSGDILRQSGAPYMFAPRDGAAFFEPGPWRLEGVRPLLRTAMKLERLPFALRVAALLGDGQAAALRPWAAACLLAKNPHEPAGQ